MSFFKTLFGENSGTANARPKTKRKAQRVLGAFVPSDVADTAATVVLAQIEGGNGSQVTDHLGRVFGSLQEMAVYRRSQSIKFKPNDQLFDALQAAAEEGGKWLTQDRADLLVWGAMEDLGTAVTLRFLPNARAGAANVFGPMDRLTLPAPIPEAFDDLILASAMGALLPVHQGSSRKLTTILQKEMAPLEKLFDGTTTWDDQSHLASALVCYGNTAMALWGVGEKKWLAVALKAYKDATAKVDRARDVLTWALAANHYAHALQAKGMADKDDGALDTAVKAYREVADALGRSSYRNEWAMARINIGMALYKLGNRETSAAKLKQSAEAFEEALGVFDKETHPGRYAEAMTQYGTVLLTLGERVQGNVVLQKAVAAFRRALDVRQKEIVPILWAQTANNLGAACFALSKRQPTAALVKEAEDSMRDAMEVYRQAGYGKQAAVIEKNLARIAEMKASGKLAS